MAVRPSLGFGQKIRYMDVCVIYSESRNVSTPNSFYTVLLQQIILATSSDMSEVQHTQMEREPPTGIEVLVAGGGIGGLSFAIEAHRKGHNVRVIERNSAGHASG